MYLFFAQDQGMEGVVCGFSRSGQELAVSGADVKVKIWDFATETLKQRLKPPPWNSCLSWSKLTEVRLCWLKARRVFTDLKRKREIGYSTRKSARALLRTLV